MYIVFFLVAENNVILVISVMQSMLMNPNYYRDNVIYATHNAHRREALFCNIIDLTDKYCYFLATLKFSFYAVTYSDNFCIFPFWITSHIVLLVNKLYQFVVAHSPGKGNLPYLPG